ncbi:MAG TPA: hypothetical protein VMV89_02915, partial [Candidatus Paceibacterota bacterium]|nr:hypothetical protein [Candidatus Paceibacterota bacterium]
WCIMKVSVDGCSVTAVSFGASRSLGLPARKTGSASPIVVLFGEAALSLERAVFPLGRLVLHLKGEAGIHRLAEKSTTPPSYEKPACA